MILLLTVISWLMIGLALDLAGVFDRSLIDAALGKGPATPGREPQPDVARGTAQNRGEGAQQVARAAPRRAHRTASSGETGADPAQRPGPGHEAVEIDGYDAWSDAIVLAYDPARIPNPSLELREGEGPGQKRLFLNGRLVMIANHAERLTLRDINLIEQPGAV